MKAVLFDLDDTLYPERDFVRGGFRAAAVALAARVPGADEAALARRMEELLDARGRGRIFDDLVDEIGVPSEALVLSLVRAYRTHRPSIRLFDDAAPALERLRARGVRLGLVTDGLAEVQRAKIAALGLEPRVDIVVCTDDLGPGLAKPSPVPFERAIGRLGVAPAEAAYVGNDPSKDFAGPNAIGMLSVQVLRRDAPAFATPVPASGRARRFVRDLAEAASLLEPPAARSEERP